MNELSSFDQKNINNLLNALLDPSFFEEFSNVLKYGIPVFKSDDDIYIFTISNKDSSFKISNLKIKSNCIDEEDFKEKIFLIKSYRKWESSDFFEDDSPIRAILDFLLIKAICDNVSDIHIDPYESGFFVSFRKNTILKRAYRLTKLQGESILMRLKVVSSLDISEKRFPMSSSFCRFFRNQNVDFRCSTHPTFLGERCVIRVLKNKSVPSIHNLGFSCDVLDIVKKVIEQPYGLIVFTGPTNSGKTTSIHSILKELVDSGLNIMTLEDPVEYRVPGIVQTNVTNVGVDFFEGMKSILRQDPNIIFLGEIRDEKTAKIAATAAMTGHKVFTTLHTDSIKGALNRLFDMGVSLRVLAEVLVAIFSQRLIRKFDYENNQYGDLTLVSDACYFENADKDILRSGEIPDIANNLRIRALELVKNGITKEEEVKRVVG